MTATFDSAVSHFQLSMLIVTPAFDTQVFAPPSFCYVFDLVGPQRAALLQQLRPVLEDPSVLKVLHDCRQDSAALKYQAGTRLQHVLDT